MTRVIALTGGIATGKSSVARSLAARGAVVVDADLLAREVVGAGSPALAEIAAEFGSTVVTGGGELDRAALGRLVFADPERRHRLEAITHPRIRALLAERLAAAARAEPPLIVADIPLLFETGAPADFEGVMLVYVDPVTQLRRLRERDQVDEGEAARRVGAQIPIDSKVGRATWVIDNSGDEFTTADQVDAWWRNEVGSTPCF